MFGLKCILSYCVPVQTIVSPYNANRVTPSIYPTTSLDFLFGIIVSFDLSFYFLFVETCTQPFCKRHYPVIVITKTRHVLYTGKCTRLYILEIINTPYNRIEHSTGYIISAIDSERDYLELSVLYKERRFNIYSII